MELSQPLRVLLTIDNDDIRLRCREILTAGGCEVCSADERSAVGPIDVVVTDRPAWKDSSAATQPGQGVQGRLYIGSVEGGCADATLPADFAKRELLMACQLLGEIVALRRNQQRLFQSHEASTKLADTDPLTSLANRRVWERRLAHELTIAPPLRRVRCLALVDLDHFKGVNDRGGMSAGDEALRQVGAALQMQLRRDDLLARLGGDEFGVFLNVASEADAVHVLERLRTAVESPSAQRGLGISASIGYTICGDTVTATATWLAAAEQALKAAKHAGGNRVCRG